MKHRFLFTALLITLVTLPSHADTSCRPKYDSFRDAQEALDAVCPGEEGTDDMCRTLEEARDDAFDDWMDCLRSVHSDPQ